MPGKSTRPKPSRNSARAGLPRPTPSEAAFERAFAALDAAAPTRKSASRPQPQEEPITPERDAFVDRVFSASEQYLRDPYSTIGDATVFNTKLAGVSFEGRQDTIAGLAPGSELTLVRQLASPVRWSQTVTALLRSVSTLIESGPGKVLTSLNRRIDRNAACFALEDPPALAAALAVGAGAAHA